LSEFFKDPHQDVSATNVNVRKRVRGERMFFAQYQAEDANGAAKQSCFFVYVYLSVKCSVSINIKYYTDQTADTSLLV